MAMYGLMNDIKENRINSQKIAETFSGKDLEIATKIKCNESIAGSYAIIIFQFGIGGAIIFGLFPMLVIPQLIHNGIIQAIIAITLTVTGFFLGYYLGDKKYGPKYDKLFKENQNFKYSHPEIYNSVLEIVEK